MSGTDFTSARGSCHGAHKHGCARAVTQRQCEKNMQKAICVPSSDRISIQSTEQFIIDAPW